MLVQRDRWQGPHAAGGEFAKPTPPLKGTAEEIAAGLRGYADVGISHVQLVLDPITTRVDRGDRAAAFSSRSTR